MSADETRIERDSMGEMEVPRDAYYGASTQRAVLNFPISGLRIPSPMIRALGLLKWAAARVNAELGRLDPRLAEAIARAAREVADGKLDDAFVVDLFQTGSGTSSNMNANEVIANRAAELLGAGRGARAVLHPNDHVNLGQSSNDIIPTAVHLGALLAINESLDPGLALLRGALERKSEELWSTIKTGRTHLQDATPIRMGQVFRGYAGQLERAERRVEWAKQQLGEVALGGTAVGTGINTHPEFAARVCAIVSADCAVSIHETDNHFQAQATLDSVVAASGALRTVAISLLKIANDVRLLASGPRTGLRELTIPEVQPGSSIMPGKVNPVIAESLIQASAQALANDQAIVQAGEWSFFELNTMLPLAG
ncbi:MAG TPA: class II fumarate hydratase, partial [Candidatus Polarisedimenticolaceae bacterium]|nr:class II fumarate hydratase [Candidatus Polarisedimenticolaceae bacterium]